MIHRQASTRTTPQQHALGEGWSPKGEASAATREGGKRTGQVETADAPTPPHGMECMKTRLYTWQVLKIAAMTSLTQFVNVS